MCDRPQESAQRPIDPRWPGLGCFRLCIGIVVANSGYPVLKDPVVVVPRMQLSRRASSFLASFRPARRPQMGKRTQSGSLHTARHTHEVWTHGMPWDELRHGLEACVSFAPGIGNCSRTSPMAVFRGFFFQHSVLNWGIIWPVKSKSIGCERFCVNVCCASIYFNREGSLFH